MFIVSQSFTNIQYINPKLLRFHMLLSVLQLVNVKCKIEAANVGRKGKTLRDY
jgi:hypothetical protein